MYNEDKITEILEGLDVDEDKIAQIVDQLKGQFNVPVLNNELEDSLEQEFINSEKDPLKKASLIAKRISKSFDE